MSPQRQSSTIPIAMLGPYVLSKTQRAQFGTDVVNTRLPASEHERATIRAFVEPSKQERFLGFLSQPRTRKKFIKDLNNFRWFDQRFATAIVWKVDPTLRLWKRHLQGMANIYHLLQSKGAGKSCYVMSGDKELDARELDLEWVLERVVDGEVGTILSCIPGKLGLYAAEDELLLLSR